MSFKKITPRSRTSPGEVRVSFSGSKTKDANIYISISLSSKLGWKSGDRVSVYVDDETPTIWMIEKSIDSLENTFKLTKVNGVKELLKLQFKMREYEVKYEDRKLKVVDYEIKDGNLIIRN